MESYDNYSGHRKMSVVERFPLFGESVIGGSTVLTDLTTSVAVSHSSIFDRTYFSRK